MNWLLLKIKGIWFIMSAIKNMLIFIKMIKNFWDMLSWLRNVLKPKVRNKELTRNGPKMRTIVIINILTFMRRTNASLVKIVGMNAQNLKYFLMILLKKPFAGNMMGLKLFIVYHSIPTHVNSNFMMIHWVPKYYWILIMWMKVIAL